VTFIFAVELVLNHSSVVDRVIFIVSALLVPLSNLPGMDQGDAGNAVLSINIRRKFSQENNEAEKL
jgi:hypothetical protein